MWTVTEFPERAKRAQLAEHPGETMIISAHPQGPAAGVPAAGSRTCHHFPPCPAATAPDRHAARTVAAHPEQGWSLLCNGVVLFDDNGELLPGGGAATHLPRRIPRGRSAGCRPAPGSRSPRRRRPAPPIAGNSRVDQRPTAPPGEPGPRPEPRHQTRLRSSEPPTPATAADWHSTSRPGRHICPITFDSPRSPAARIRTEIMIGCSYRRYTPLTTPNDRCCRYV